MRITYIELLGERHPLCFSLSAIEQIADTFGGIEEMQAALGDDSNTVKQMKNVITLLKILMRAGRRYYKLMDEELPRDLIDNVGDLLDFSDPRATAAVFEAIGAGSEEEIKTQSKNV